jgi:hypothetical protein
MNPDMNGGIKRKNDETKAKGCHTFVERKKVQNFALFSFLYSAQNESRSALF